MATAEVLEGEDDVFFLGSPTTRRDLWEVANSFARSAYDEIEREGGQVSHGNFEVIAANCDNALVCLEALEAVVPRPSAAGGLHRIRAKLCLLASQAVLRWDTSESGPRRALMLANRGLVAHGNDVGLLCCKGNALECLGDYEASRAQFVKVMPHLLPNDLELVTAKILALREKQRQRSLAGSGGESAAVPLPARPKRTSAEKSAPSLEDNLPVTALIDILSKLDRETPRDSFTPRRLTVQHHTWDQHAGGLAAPPSHDPVEESERYLAVASAHIDFFVSGQGVGSTPEEARRRAEAALARALQGGERFLREQLPRWAPDTPWPAAGPTGVAAAAIKQRLQEARCTAWANAAQSRAPKQLIVVVVTYQTSLSEPVVEEANFGMLLPELPEGSESASLSHHLALLFSLRSERRGKCSLRGKVSFRNGGQVPPLDEAAWRRVLRYSAAWKVKGGGDKEPASMAMLLGETEEIVIVPLTDGAINLNLDEGPIDAASKAVCPVVYRTSDVLDASPQSPAVDDQLLHILERESLLGGVSPFFVRSAVAEWLRLHPRKLKTAETEAALHLLGETVLDLLVALHEFLLPDTEWSAQPAELRPNSRMTNHAALREAIHKRLRKCSEAGAVEAAHAMVTRGRHFTEAWRGSFRHEERPAAARHVAAASAGPDGSRRQDPGFTEFFVSNDSFLHVKYKEPVGWLRYHQDCVSGQRRLYEQELHKSTDGEWSPSLEEPGRWKDRMEVVQPLPGMSRAWVYKSPALARLKEKHPSLDAALPAKVMDFLLGDKPAQSLQSLQHNGQRTSRYIFLRESADLAELSVGYVVTGTEICWRRYRPSRDGLCSGFEWSADGPATALAPDRLSSFKRALDLKILSPQGEDGEPEGPPPGEAEMAERRWAWLTEGRETDSIDRHRFTRMLRELSGIEKGWDKEIWFRLVGPDEAKLRKPDLGGRWLEVRYSEHSKTLLSGRPIGADQQQLILCPKLIEFLKRRHLASLVVPKPGALGNESIDITSKRDGARCVLLCNGEPLVYSEQAKTWIGLPPGADATEMQEMLVFEGDTPPQATEPEAEPDGTHGRRAIHLSGKGSGDAQQRAQRGLLTVTVQRPVAEAFRSQWACCPSTNPPAHVRGPVPRALNIPKVEAVLGHKFSNPVLVVEAHTHSSFCEGEIPCVTPSQRCLAVLGEALVHYLLVELVLAHHGLLTPDFADLQEKLSGQAERECKGAPPRVEDPAWLRFEHLRDTLDAAMCAASLARACVHLELHHQLLYNSPGLAEVLSRIPLQQEEDSAGPSWEQFVRSDAAPRCLRDTFCAAVAAVFLDATWAPAHRILSELVERTVLKPMLRTKWFQLLPLRPGPFTSGGSAEDLAFSSAADLSPKELGELLADAAARGSVLGSGWGAAASCWHEETVKAYSMGEIDDQHFFQRVSGSCKLTARVRASCPSTVGAAVKDQVTGQRGDLPKPIHTHPFCSVCGAVCASLEAQQQGHCSGKMHEREAAARASSQAGTRVRTDGGGEGDSGSCVEGGGGASLGLHPLLSERAPRLGPDGLWIWVTAVEPSEGRTSTSA